MKKEGKSKFRLLQSRKQKTDEKGINSFSELEYRALRVSLKTDDQAQNAYYEKLRRSIYNSAGYTIEEESHCVENESNSKPKRIFIR